MIQHTYELADDLPDGTAIDIREDRGSVHFRLNANLPPADLVAALNTGADAVLAGGHWFQEWKGDIIGRDTPRTFGQGIPLQRPTTHGTGEYGAA